MKKKYSKNYDDFEEAEDEDVPVKKSYKDYDREKKEKDLKIRKSRELKSQRYEN
jgi:hypothetical protein